MRPSSLLGTRSGLEPEYPTGGPQTTEVSRGRAAALRCLHGDGVVASERPVGSGYNDSLPAARRPRASSGARGRRRLVFLDRAGVAELADAPDSKSGATRVA